MSARVPSRKCSNDLKPLGSPGHFRKECQSPYLPVCFILSLRNTARGCRFGRTATRSSAAATRPGASHRNAPCASSILPVKNALSTIVDPQCRLSHLRRVNAGRPRSSWRCWAHQTTPSRRLPIRSRCQTGFSATSGCWSSSVESPKSWFRIT